MNPYEEEQVEKEVDEIIRRSNIRGSIVFGSFLFFLSVAFITMVYFIDQITNSVFSYFGLVP
jgi:hypothetical protein